VASEVIGQWFTIKGLVTSLILLLCVAIFSNTFSAGAFPAILPELGRGGGLADWQLGTVAGAYGFARMMADIPIGLFLTHHLRRAVVVGPCVLAAGVVLLTSGGPFSVLVLGRLLMGVGHALGMVAGLTAILHYRTGLSLASALNAYEFSAMIGILCGTVVIGVLPSSLAWNWALLVTCAPQVIGILTLPALLRTLPRSEGTGPKPLFARRAAAGPAAALTPAAVLAFVAGGAIAVAYSTVEQFAIPLRGSRELGLERAGVARLLVVMQVVDIAALLPVGVLADRRGTERALVAVLLVTAAGSALVGFGTLPVVTVGCALYGLGMAGWMLPLGVLRRETPREHVAWRTGLYRVGVDGGIFLGPFLAGLLGAGHARTLAGVWAGALALTAVLFLVRERRRS
jgi:MFS family permease